MISRFQYLLENLTSLYAFRRATLFLRHLIRWLQAKNNQRTNKPWLHAHRIHFFSVSDNDDFARISTRFDYWPCCCCCWCRSVIVRKKKPELTEYILMSMCGCSLAFVITEKVKQIHKILRVFLDLLSLTLSIFRIPTIVSLSFTCASCSRIKIKIKDNLMRQDEAHINYIIEN